MSEAVKHKHRALIPVSYVLKARGCVFGAFCDDLFCSLRQEVVIAYLLASCEILCIQEVTTSG